MDIQQPATPAESRIAPIVVGSGDLLGVGHLQKVMPKKQYLKIMREAWRATPMRKKEKCRYYKDANAAMNKSRWMPYEDEIVMKMNEPDHQIAARLGRSTKAVEIRRVRLKAAKTPNGDYIAKD